MSVGGGPEGVRRVPKSDVDMSHDSSSPGSCPAFALYYAPAFLLYLASRSSTPPMSYACVCPDCSKTKYGCEIHLLELKYLNHHLAAARSTVDQEGRARAWFYYIANLPGGGTFFPLIKEEYVLAWLPEYNGFKWLCTSKKYTNYCYGGTHFEELTNE